MTKGEEKISPLIFYNDKEIRKKNYKKGSPKMEKSAAPKWSKSCLNGVRATPEME